MQRVDWWNLFFMFFFVALVWFAYQLLGTLGRIPSGITIWDTAVLALASFRLTRLVVYDSITQWVRDLFADAAPRTAAGTLRTLVNCPWCIGLWFALVVATTFFAWPESWFMIFVAALGGLASLVQIAANLLGWSAEFKKRATIGPAERDIGSKCG